MNILPKKSWHVRNKDNVEKVRKDEENARLEAKEQSRRAALAEQEARTDFLRKKARSRALESSDDLKSLLQNDTGGQKQIIPFPNRAQGEPLPSSSMKNVEHEREKKEEQVNYEKKVGILTYLGQSATESMEDSDKPWYVKVPEKKAPKRTHLSEDESIEKEQKSKNALDPIHTIQAHLQKKKRSEKHSRNYKKQKRKHKHHAAEKEIHPKGKIKLKKLRKERLEREKKERERTIALLNGGDADTKQEAPGRYNSQFNPHLARVKNYSRSRY